MDTGCSLEDLFRAMERDSQGNPCCQHDLMMRTKNSNEKTKIFKSINILNLKKNLYTTLCNNITGKTVFCFTDFIFYHNNYFEKQFGANFLLILKETFLIDSKKKNF